MTATTAATSPSLCVHIYLGALGDLDKEAYSQAWHSNGRRLYLTPAGTVESKSPALKATRAATECRLLALTLVSDTCACAKVRYVQSPKTITEFVTMLKGGEHQRWKIISSVSSISTEAMGAPSLPSEQISPGDFTEVSTAMWDGYMAAGRACDSEAMQNVFHPDCRLTYSTDNGIMIISSDDFYRMVGERWSIDPYLPFAHLKDDPRVANGDSLVGIDFAGPNVAMVTLNIGYPPFLYHDVLLLLRLSQPGGPERRLGYSSGGWWIVAKSSDREPWMENERWR